MNEPVQPSLFDLREAVSSACQPTHPRWIISGRDSVLAMPREWVVEHLEMVACDVLDLGDYWEYRRLLELAQLIDGGILARLVAFGLKSSDPDITDAANDFRVARS